MAVQFSLAGPTLLTDARADRGIRFSPLRWLTLGVVSLALVIIALSRGGAVGAAAPTAYDVTCIPINATTCVTSGGVVATPYMTIPAFSAANVSGNATSSGYPVNTILSTYVDPRYGVVSVETDATGNLIDVNAVTGQRIYPIYPDYGNAIATAYNGGSYAYPNLATYPYLFGGPVG